MEIKKHKLLLTGLGIGLVAGMLIGFLFNRYALQSENFSVQILNQHTAIKLNKRTGQTWRFFRGELEKGWQPIDGAKLANP